MITMKEIDYWREEANAALAYKRVLAENFGPGRGHDEWCLAGHPCDYQCAGLVHRLMVIERDLARYRAEIEKRLVQWWEQGCKEV